MRTQSGAGRSAANGLLVVKQVQQSEGGVRQVGLAVGR